MKLNEKTLQALKDAIDEKVIEMRVLWKEATTVDAQDEITTTATVLKAIAAAIPYGTIQILTHGERTETETSLRSKVKEMRDAQREYFKTRSRSALDRSRSLERAVDSILAADNTQQLPKQQTLF